MNKTKQKTQLTLSADHEALGIHNEPDFQLKKEIHIKSLKKLKKKLLHFKN